VPSTKRIVGLRQNVEYQALSRDAKTGHGQGVYVLVIDEAGQIDAPNDDFLDMLRTSLGTYSDSREFIISTQAPSDAAFLSVEIDSAIADHPTRSVIGEQVEMGVACRMAVLDVLSRQLPRNR
jgi:hypothetical protein